MVIESGVGVKVVIVVPKVETHVVEDIAGFVIDLFLSCRESIYEPIEGIVLPNPLIYELGVLRRNIGYSAQLLADAAVFEHFDLRKRQQ